MRSLGLMVMIAASFFLAAKLPTISNSTFTFPLWPASGVAIGMLGLFGGKFWPAIALGAFITHYLQNFSLFTSLGLSASNITEAFFTLFIINRIKQLGKSPLEIKTPLAYLLGSIGGALTASTFGILILSMGKNIDTKNWDDLWITWSVCHGLGNLLIAPVFIALKEKLSSNFIFKRKIEKLLLFFLLIIISALILLKPVDSVYLFLFTPLLLLMVYRTGSLGVKVSALIISVIAITGYLTGAGPFTHFSSHENLIRIQLFLSMIALTALILSGFIKARPLKLTGIVLGISWITTLIVYLSFRASEDQRDIQRFNTLIEQTSQAINNRMRVYEDALRGGMSLILSSDNITKKEWRTYSTLTKLRERYPGISNMGVAWHVKRKDEKAFTLKQRAKGMPEFYISLVKDGVIPGYQESQKPRYVVTYSWFPELEGRDLGSESIRRMTFDKARDSGLLTLSDQIHSIRTDELSFLMALPFYQDGVIRETAEERRKTLQGLIYAFFVAETFFEQIMGNNSNEELNVKVLDSKNHTLFTSQPGKSKNIRLEKITQLNLGQNQLTFIWTPSQSFLSLHDSTTAWIAFFGTIFSLLLAVIVAGIEESNRKAFKIEKLEIEKRATIMASKLKSDFLANMSHEIRTPITGMIGMTEFLMETNLSPSQKEYAKAIKSSGDALLSMVNGVLDFSKIEAGKLEFESIDFELSPVLKSIESSFFIIARNKGLSLRIEKDDSVPEWFKGDPARLLQVFMNLVSNAIKFSYTGEIKFRVRLLDLDVQRALLRFEVKDQGIGISPEAQANLFKPFTQADSSTSRRFGGSGLGLSISRNLVEGMGGKIGVISNENEGSLFWIEIKLQLGKELQKKSHFHEIDIREKRLKVLIAEDNIINQKVTMKMFQKMGAEAHVVGNGMELLDSLKSQTYDLVVMDCQMPLMDGFEATHLFRNGKPILNKDIPIVALTANATMQSRERCLELGMNDFLPKPIVYEELKRVVSQWVRSRIDWHAVNKIKEFNQNGDLLAELISLYLVNGPEAVDKMFASYLQEDWNSIRVEAHKLKSSSLMIGARIVAEICEKMETDIENGKIEDVHICLKDLKREIGKALAELKQLA